MCPTCLKGPSELIYCLERRPGAKGNMAQSFGGSYRICGNCVQRLAGAKSIDYDQAATDRYERRLITLAGSYAWLKAVQPAV